MNIFLSKKEQCGDHLSLVGWHSFSKVIKVSAPYWEPSLDEKVQETLEEDDSEGESEEL